MAGSNEILIHNLNLLAVNIAEDDRLIVDGKTRGTRKLDASFYAQRTQLAPFYNSASAYKKGDLVLKDKELRMANTDVAAGSEFDSTKWYYVNINNAIPLVTQKTADMTSSEIGHSIDVDEGTNCVTITFHGLVAQDTTNDVKIVGMSSDAIKADNAGKVLAINSTGDGVELITPTTELEHDSTIEGNGTEESPLSVKTMVGALDPQKFVKVGKNVYPIVKIGNLYWLAQNIREDVGTNLIKTDDLVNYGRLYLLSSILNDGTPSSELASIIPTGWRVPTQGDGDALYDSVPGSSTSQKSLAVRSTSGWSSTNGTNSSGFNLFPSGSTFGTTLYGYGTEAFVIGSRHFNNSYVGLYVKDGSLNKGYPISDSYYIPVRFCCDASTIEGNDGNGKKGLVPQPLKADVDKFLKGDGSWADPPASTFTATYNSTKFADIASAVSAGKCVKCDMSGYTYELVQYLSTKITFSATNNVNGTIAQETIWVNSDDTWDSEGVNIAKKSEMLTMQVVTEPPAEGTPETTLSVILDEDPTPVVLSDDVTRIVKVTELPEEPDPNTLYLVVEEEATTASDTSETEV